jgi:cytosine/adenosine deaminase-related metal-dependent hydrolase
VRTLALTAVVLACASAGTAATQPALLLEASVVTMDDAHTIVPNGRVLVRDGVIVAVWSGATPPGVDTRDARIVRGTYVFPGLINLHDHPSYDVLPLWPPPSSHNQPTVGRVTGHEPYDNRYQWSAAPPTELQQRVIDPHTALEGLGLVRDVLVHAEVRAALSGETAIEGESTGILIRAVEGTNFGRARIEARVNDVTSPLYAAPLAQRLANGQVDAWLVHLAEGVRDGDRAPGDPFSSRHELDEIRALGLLTRATVVLHGIALEQGDFAAITSLVWSPLSNLILYGRTANVAEAITAGVNVSLGTDWTPTGSNTLLDELKVGAVLLHDPRTLADMVTRNPARALGWSEVGSVEAGKHADLLVLNAPAGGDPYAALVRATARDVRLVLVDGRPVSGDPDALRAAGAIRIQLVRSAAGRFTKGVVLAGTPVASVEATLRTALLKLGNRAWLRAHWHGDRSVLAKLKLVPLTETPLFSADDRARFDFLHGTRAPYPANRNWIGANGNPFARLAHG